MPCGGRKAGRRRPWPRGTEGCCPRPGPAWCGSARPAAGREGRTAARGAGRDPRTSPGRQLQPLVLASVSLCYTEPVCRAKGTKLLCVTQGNGNSVAGSGRWGAGPFEGPGHGSCESTVSVQRGPPPPPAASWVDAAPEKSQLIHQACVSRSVPRSRGPRLHPCESGIFLMENSPHSARTRASSQELHRVKYRSGICWNTRPNALTLGSVDGRAAL